MSQQSKEMYEFKKQIKALANFQGKGTELISLYIGPGMQVSDFTGKLRDEFGQAANIKSKATQKNVQAAIERAMQYLKTLGHKAPANGIAIFCGNVSEHEGKSDVQLFSIIPPAPLSTSFYRCESTFQIEPLEEMLEQTGAYGLVVLDGKEATIAILKGKVYKIIRRLTSTAHQKVVKGGQCLHESTLIQREDGAILQIRDLKEGEKILSANWNNFSIYAAECSSIYSRSSNKAYKLFFQNPKTSIKATPEHLFFVLTEKGFEEKPAEELREGDNLALLLKTPVMGGEVKLPKAQTFTALSEPAGELLKEARLSKGMLQREVASALGWKQADISELERQANITSEKLELLAHFYGLPSEKTSQLTVQIPRISLPEKLTPELAQFIGYLLGDGTFDGNRLVLFDEDSNLLGHYQELSRNLFSLAGAIRKREEKGYFELKIYSKWLSEYLQINFAGLREKRGIPSDIQKANTRVVAGFLRGLFDAEATASSERISISMANHSVITQSAFLLARFGIVCSVSPKRSRYSPQFSLDITDRQSLELFQQFIGFSSQKKAESLQKIVSLKSWTSRSLTVPVSGLKLLSMALKCGFRARDFWHSPDFIRGRKTISFASFEKTVIPVFRRRHDALCEVNKDSIKELRKVLRVRAETLASTIGISRTTVFNIENGASQNPLIRQSISVFLLAELERQSLECRKLLDLCSTLMNSELTFCTLTKKREFTPLPDEKFYDLTVPGYENFVANRLIVHNSAGRFQRIHEEEVEVYYKRIGEAMDAFLNQKNFKGAILGGPGPAKEDFMKQKPYNYQLKILGVVDTGYTDEHGLKELLDKSGDLIQEQEAIKEKALLNQFMKEIATEGLATYGYDEIKNAIAKNQISKLLVSEGLELYLLKIECAQCGNKEEKVFEGKLMDVERELICSKCGSKAKLAEQRDLLTELQDAAAARGVEIEIISRDTGEGEQFFGTFHGIGAFLRYK